MPTLRASRSATPSSEPTPDPGRPTHSRRGLEVTAHDVAEAQEELICVLERTVRRTFPERTPDQLRRTSLHWARQIAETLRVR